jgi:hypothetical protein
MNYRIIIWPEEGYHRSYLATEETVHAQDWQKIITEAVDDMEKSHKEDLPF